MNTKFLKEAFNEAINDLTMSVSEKVFLCQRIYSKLCVEDCQLISNELMEKLLSSVWVKDFNSFGKELRKEICFNGRKYPQVSRESLYFLFSVLNEEGTSEQSKKIADEIWNSGIIAVPEKSNRQRLKFH